MERLINARKTLIYKCAAMMQLFALCRRKDIVDTSKSEGTILAAILIGTAITLRQSDRDQTMLHRIVSSVAFEGNIA